MTALTTRTNWRTEPAMLYQVVNNTSTEKGFDLFRGGIQALRGDHRWRLVYCHQGKVWITQKHDLEDHVLQAGEAFLINQRGLVLIKALRDSQLEISPSLKVNPFKGELRFFS